MFKSAYEAMSSTHGRILGLVGIDLAWRLPLLSPTDIPVSDLVLATVSLGLGISQFDTLEWVTTWGLLGYVAVVFAPKGYSPITCLPPDEKEEWFALLIGGMSLVAAFAISTLFAPVISVNNPGVPTWSLLLVPIVFLAYFYWGLGWGMFESRNRYFNMIKIGIAEPTHPADGVRYGSPRWVIRHGIVMLAATMLVSTMVILGGILVLLLLLAYPLTDIIIILGVMSTFVYDEQSGMLSTENQVFDQLSIATSSVNGMVLSLYLALTGILFVFLYALGAGLLTDGSIIQTLSVEVIRVAPRLFWGILGLPISIVTCATYGLWCCYRMIPRLSGYIAFQIGERPKPPLESPRPVGYVLPPLFALLVLVWAADWSGLGSMVFAIAWPLCCGWLGLCAWMTRKRDRRSVRFETHAIVAGVLCMVFFFVTFSTFFGSGWEETGNQLMLFVPILLWVGYFGEVGQIADQYSDYRKHAMRAYCLVGAAFLPGMGLLAGGMLFPAMLGAGGLLLIAVLLDWILFLQR